jgi:predicted dehydrogenase/threonine dehydrogenase-like Zn-dependent dehydrogenase
MQYFHMVESIFIPEGWSAFLMKQLLQNMRDGKTTVVDVPVPTPQAGMVLIRTGASLVSAGTERMMVEFAEKSLVGKARSRPDLVRQVINKARREGLLSTAEAAFNRLDQPMPLGYSSTGTIVELGEGVQGYRVGDRVACAGSGYAVHAEYAVVPINLVAPLPDSVDFEGGACGTMGAIAMHGFRLAQPQIGENVLVIGLGFLGLLTTGIAQAAGCKVMGIDLDPKRVALAKEMGVEAVMREGAEEAAAAFSHGLGMDVVLICADAESNDPVELAGTASRDRGRVVAVGAVGMDIPRRSYYQKELDFIVSRSYGPGRYDPIYEEGGLDYPLGFVRWTAGRNLEAFVNLLGDGGMDVSRLITHRFPIDEAAEAYKLITNKKGEAFLGVLLTYPQDEAAKSGASKTILTSAKVGHVTAEQVKLGVIGAGNFASAVMLPVLKSLRSIRQVGIASATGLSAQHLARKFGFAYATSETEVIFSDPVINTVALFTRHNLHAAQILEGLRAGKHVFCEKPLAIHQEELIEISTELEKPEAPLLMVGFNRRFAPMSIEMKAFLDTRHEPLLAHYRVNAGYLPPEHWLHNPEQGGGRIVGEGCHFIDFLTWLVGVSPTAVSAQGLPDVGRYAEDNVALTFEFPDGSLGTVTYLANGDKSLPKERVEVFSSGWVAILDDFRTLTTIRGGRRRVRHIRWRQDKGHKGEWKAFMKAVIESGEPPIPYDQLMGISRASFTALEALRRGEKLTIS